MAHGQHETRGSWILLICASVLAAFGAFGIKSFSNIENSLIVGSVTSRLLVFLLAVILAVVALKKINKRKILGISRRQHPVVHLDESHAKQLQDSASDSNLFDATLAGIFFIGVERPRELRQRVVESYELGSRVLHQRVSIEGKIPRYVLERPGGKALIPQTIYVPILVPLKGKFQDNFSLVDGDGNALLALSYREYLNIAALTLRVILTRLLGYRTPNSLSPEEKTAELRALKLIQSRRGDDGKIPDMAAIDTWYGGFTARASLLNSVASFVRKLAEHYAIVAEVHPDENGRFLLKFEQTLIPDLKLSRRGILGTLLGTRPVDIALSLNAAMAAQSYHLRVNAPDGIYLGDQRLLDSDQTLKSVDQDAKIPPHYRFRRRLGQGHAHFYSRYFPKAALIPGVNSFESPAVRLTYYEAPPGSLLRAAASGMASLMLIWTVGVIGSRVDGQIATDAPAVLLAFPAVVAAWLGFESPSRRLLEGTLLGRLSLFATVGLSLIASGLFLLHNSKSSINWKDQQFGGGFNIFWITDWTWAATFTLALLNVSIVLYQYCVRVAFFSYLSGRKEGADVLQYV